MFLEGAVAIHGVCVCAGRLWVFSDGQTHADWSLGGVNTDPQQAHCDLLCTAMV